MPKPKLKIMRPKKVRPFSPYHGNRVLLDRRVTRTGVELQMLLSWHEGATLELAHQIRNEVKPWDFGHLLAEQIVQVVKDGRGHEMGQIGMSYDLSELDPEALETVNYTARMFMGIGQPEETAAQDAQLHAMAGSTGSLDKPIAVSSTTRKKREL